MMHSFITELKSAIHERVGIGCETLGNSKDGFSDFYIRSSEPEYAKPQGWFLRVELLAEILRLEFGFDDSAGFLCKFYFGRLKDLLNELVELEKNFESEYFPLNFIHDEHQVQIKDLVELNTPLNFRIKTKGRITEEEEFDEAARKLILDFLIFALKPLLPEIESDEFEDFLFEDGLPEGAFSKVLVNKYERNPKNRSACLNHYGVSCMVCGFDFGTEYGEFAADYIHVHHIIPVSQMGANYVVDPVKDLVPLCPNCHSAVHLENPPISPEKLKEKLMNRKLKNLP